MKLMVCNYLKEVAANPDAAFEHMHARLKHLKNIERSSNIFTRQYVSEGNFQHVFDKIKSAKAGKPLYGTFFSVKDVFAVKGQPLSLGLLPGLPVRNEKHAVAVAHFISQGASLIGSTNLDPLCLSYYGENKDFGPVINPNFKAFFAGGSSSGSAASVASGVCDFSLGSDSGGSVRLPAAFCGIAGLKASEDTLSTKGMFQISSSFDKAGIIAESPEVISTLTDPGSCTEIKKIFIPKRSELKTLSDPLHFETFDNILKKLSSHIDIEELDVPLELEQAAELRKKILAIEFEKSIAKFALPFEELPGPAKSLLTLRSNIASPDELYRNLNEYRERQSTLLEDKIILSPTLTRRPLATTERADNIHLFLLYANVADVPALSFALKTEQVGTLPYSLQLIGKKNSDSSLLLLGNTIYQLIHT